MNIALIVVTLRQNFPKHAKNGLISQGQFDLAGNRSGKTGTCKVQRRFESFKNRVSIEYRLHEKKE